MKTISILISIGLLVGCTVDNTDSCNTIHSYTTEQVDQNGLTLQPSENMYSSFEQVSQYYSETMACMGMPTAGPDIEYKSFTRQYIGGVWAVYIANGRLVWINTDDMGLGFDRDCRTDREALKHEFIHHILHENGNDDLSRYHSSKMFEKCGLGVNTYN